MSDPERAFLAAILAAADDDGPRLVYADWLEDTGTDPARGELIRVQCELAVLRTCRDSLERIFPLMDREAALLDADDARTLRWFGLPQPWARIVRTEPFDVDSPDYPYAIARRGFVDEVRLRAKEWLQLGPLVICAHPLRRVTLTDKRPYWGREGWRFSHGRQGCNSQEFIPAALCQHWPSPWSGGAYWQSYPSVGAAAADLSRACLAWAKSTARTVAEAACR